MHTVTKIYLAAVAIIVGLLVWNWATPAHHVAHPSRPVAQCALWTGPPCSAITPTGAVGADKSQYANTPILTFGNPFSTIHIDAAGMLLISQFENVYEARYCPYWDPFGHVYTRGFGETDWNGNFGGVCISHAQAETNLKSFVESKYQYAVRGLGMSLNQCQVNALDDFVWNLGAGIFTGTLRWDIQHHIWSAILGYDIAGGQVLSGLRNRRYDEYYLLSRPCHDHTAPPLTPKQIHAKRAKELNAELLYRTHVRAYLAAHHCRAGSHPRWVPHTHRQHLQCNAVEKHGQRAVGRIRTLEKELS